MLTILYLLMLYFAIVAVTVPFLFRYFLICRYYILRNKNRNKRALVLCVIGVKSAARDLLVQG